MMRTMFSSLAVATMLSLGSGGHAVSGDVDGRDFLVWQRGGSPSKAKSLAGKRQGSQAKPCIPGGLPPDGCPPWHANKKKGPKGS